jgi:hypothetical protein
LVKEVLTPPTGIPDYSSSTHQSCKVAKCREIYQMHSKIRMAWR